MKNYFIILVLFLILSGCSGDRCIDADDFGHMTFDVSARYTNEELEGQEEDKQVAPWRNSNLRVNGKPLAIMVKGWDNGVEANTVSELSAWCPWFGTSDDDQTLVSMCARFLECQFGDDEPCTDTPDANIVNAPCILKKGVGLYALIAEKDFDPNLSIETRRNPLGLTFHVGAKTEDYSMYEIDKDGKTREAGGRVFHFQTDDLKEQYRDSEIYFKILDKFYDDNSGKYKIVIKSGISQTDADPIIYVTNLVKGFIFGENNEGGIARGIYLGIVNNAAYRLVVSTLLTLYVIYTALIYLAGSIELTRTELIVRICKIAVVGALLNTETSWSFFNDYLFVYFVDGMEQILKIIYEVGNTGPGSSGIIGLFFAPQTLYKMLSLLFTDWLGIVYIIIFMIVMFVLLLILFQATVIYLTALIAISLMIMMGPIFICFLLFDFTKSLFENWLKQLISHAFQPIILFTGVVFISVMIRHEIYASLGFRICKHNILYMTGVGGAAVDTALSLFDAPTEERMGEDLGNSIFYWWFPEPMIGSEFTRETKLIPIPEAHFPDEPIIGSVPSVAGNSDFCEAYGCIGERYVDLPFLDPVKDIRRINHFWSGRFVQLDGLLLIIIALYLLYKFNSLAVNVARFLTDTTSNQSNIQAVGSQAMSDLKNSIGNVGKALNKVASMTARGVGGAAGAAGRRIGQGEGTSRSARIISKSLSAVETVGKGTSKALDQGVMNTAKALAKEQAAKVSPSALVDKVRINSLKKDALSASANKSVLAEVKRSTGLTRDGLNANAKSQYQKALEAAIAKHSNLSKKDQMKMAKRMSNRRLSDLDKDFAKIKYGKGYSNLNDTEKLSIKEILSNRTLRNTSNDAANATRFQNEYVKAYSKLSDQGVGLVGKNLKPLRVLQKTHHRIKENEQMRDQKDKLLGKKILGTLDHDNHISAKKNNPRHLTLGEIKKEERDAFKAQKNQIEIEKYSSKLGEKVTTPEFLAKAEMKGDLNRAKYEKLSNKELDMALEQEIRSATRNDLGKKEYLDGDYYLEHKAKDSSIRGSVDHLRRVEENFIKQDPMLLKEDEYRMKSEEAVKNIKTTTEGLNIKDDISMRQLSSEVNNELNSISREKDQARYNELSKLKSSIDQYSENETILAKIEARKARVHKNIDSRIKKINDYRKKAGMDEYNGG